MTPVVLSALFDHLAADYKTPEPELERGTIGDLLDLKAMVNAHA